MHRSHYRVNRQLSNSQARQVIKDGSVFWGLYQQRLSLEEVFGEKIKKKPRQQFSCFDSFSGFFPLVNNFFSILVDDDVASRSFIFWLLTHFRRKNTKFLGMNENESFQFFFFLLRYSVSFV